MVDIFQHVRVVTNGVLFFPSRPLEPVGEFRTFCMVVRWVGSVVVSARADLELSTSPSARAHCTIYWHNFMVPTVGDNP